MIKTSYCNGKCSSPACKRQGGWYVWSEKLGIFKYETAKMGPFRTRQKALAAGWRAWPEHSGAQP